MSATVRYAPEATACLSSEGLKKKAWASRSLAEAWALIQYVYHDRVSLAYKCKQCGQWHLTTKDSNASRRKYFERTVGHKAHGRRRRRGDA